MVSPRVLAVLGFKINSIFVGSSTARCGNIRMSAHESAREGEMFLRNAWYVGAWDHEVTAEKPFGRIMLSEPVVFYRKRDGGMVALICH